MSRYTNGWTWHNEATDEQREDPVNKGAIDRLYDEIRHAYDSIPDPEDERTQERLAMRWEAIAEDQGPAAADAAEVKHKETVKKTWGQIEAIEELMAQRGARLKDDYEHHNEFAGQMRYMEEGRFSSEDRD